MTKLTLTKSDFLPIKYLYIRSSQAKRIYGFVLKLFMDILSLHLQVLRNQH